MRQLLTLKFTEYISQMLTAEKNNLFIAIGAGRASWDTAGLPNDIAPNISSLIDQKSILPIDSINYLDSNNEVTTTVTSKLRIVSARFTAEDYEGYDSTPGAINPIRECGLFIYDSTTDTYTMFLYSVFGRIDITPQITFTKNLTIDLAL